MVWDTRDVPLLDLSVLPRSGMPKPPHLQNWGDLTNHSSGASILPRSSSPHAVFWRPGSTDEDSVLHKGLHLTLSTDTDFCKELGFVPGTAIWTPSGYAEDQAPEFHTDCPLDLRQNFISTLKYQRCWICRRLAKIIGAIQPDSRYPSNWRLWAEYTGKNISLRRPTARSS